MLEPFRNAQEPSTECGVSEGNGFASIMTRYNIEPENNCGVRWAEGLEGFGTTNTICVLIHWVTEDGTWNWWCCPWNPFNCCIKSRRRRVEGEAGHGPWWPTGRSGLWGITGRTWARFAVKSLYIKATMCDGKLETGNSRFSTRHGYASCLCEGRCSQKAIHAS